MRSLSPNALKNETAPPAPTRTATRFGTVRSALMLTLDVDGRGDPAGNTVTKPPRVGPSTVTFSITTVASDGTGERPAMVTVNVWSSPTGTAAVPMPLRVSTTR